MAGPLERLSILNWMALRSETIPLYPPKASISRTIWPLAIPPIAGLQDICPMVCRFMVINSVFDPILAAAAAASAPAWPPPTTITSYTWSNIACVFHVEHCYCFFFCCTHGFFFLGTFIIKPQHV